MDPRRQFGNEGERVAVEYLKKKKYRIIAAPWRVLPLGEIDIVAERGNTLIFVEVKSRSSSAFGYPEQSVTHAKQQKLRRLIELYLSKNRIIRTPYRCDVIAIEFGADPPRITHLESVALDG